LDGYLRKNLESKTSKDRFVWKTRFLDSFARYLNQLYKKKVYLVELKAEEIFVEELGEKSWRFYFGNVNKIIFNHPVAPDKQMRNLVQLHTSISLEVSWKDRLRFLSGFLRSWPREKRKGFIREVLTKIG
jgi:hypothetical protein